MEDEEYEEPRMNVHAALPTRDVADRLRFLGYADAPRSELDVYLDPKDGDIAVVFNKRTTTGEWAPDIEFYARRIETIDGEDTPMLCSRRVSQTYPLTPYQLGKLYNYEEETKNERRDEHWVDYWD